MSASFPCPYLGGEVELTDEREEHIALQHPDLLPALRHVLATNLADPDEIRPSARTADARLFTRWYHNLHGGKHVVVVVVSHAADGRHWIVTAYVARRLVRGNVEWTRN